MDFDDLVARTRLKFFLARQADLRRATSTSDSEDVVTPQQAFLLAGLAFMKQYDAADMNQGDISQLLSISPQRLATLTGMMAAKGLVEEVTHDAGKNTPDKHYRITASGLRQLSRFAEGVLGTPDAVEAGLRENDRYREMLADADELINQDLRQRYRAAREINGRKKAPKRKKGQGK